MHRIMCFSMRGGVAASVKRSCADDLLCISLQMVYRKFCWVCCRSCQAWAHWRRAAWCILKTQIHLRQGVWLTAVLPLQLGAVHAAVVDCASQCASVGCAYGVRPCSRVWLRELRVEGRRKVEEGWGSHGCHNVIKNFLLFYSFPQRVTHSQTSR